MAWNTSRNRYGKPQHTRHQRHVSGHRWRWFNALIHSFRVWIIAGYVAILLVLALDCAVTYHGFATAHREIAHLIRNDAALATLDEYLVLSRNEAFYRGIGILMVGGIIALVATYAIAESLLGPLRAIDQVLMSAGDVPHPSVDEQWTPTELLPLVWHCNAMTEAVNHRQHELYDQLGHTALLTRLSIELRETLDPDRIVRHVLSAIVSNIDHASASIIMLDGKSAVEQGYTIRDNRLRPITVEKAELLLGQGLAGWVLQQGCNVVLPDVRQDDRWLKARQPSAVVSAMALPLTHTRATLGVLTITHPERAHFTSKDLLLLEGVAAQASAALSSAQRHRGEQRRREQALLLFAMSQSLTMEQSLDDLAHELLQKGHTAFDAVHAALFLCQHEDAHPTLVAVRPDNVQPSELGQDDLSARLHDQLAAAAEESWRTQKAVSGVLPTEYLTVFKRTLSPWNTLTPAYVAMPLLHNGAAIGVFLIVRETNGTLVFSADMWSVLTTFTNVAAAAFANLQLVERLHQRAEVLEQEVSERTIQLQHSRDLLRVMFDHLPDGLLLLDMNATILAANHAFCADIVGVHPRSVVLGHYPTIMQVFQQHKQVQFEPSLDTVPAQRIRCTDSQGKQRWYVIDRYPIESGNQHQAIERWRDITRQEEIHRQLLLHEQLASMGRLALSVVHEVGNPLQSVRGCLDLCREEGSLSPSAVNYLTLADTELERMSHIIQRLRDLYRPSQLAWERVSFNDLIGVVQRITERQLQRCHVHLVTILEPLLPQVYGQRDALHQVVLNVILNAQEAMPMGGIIRVVTDYHPERRMCSFQVSDTGTGIAPDHLEHIFEPFNTGKAQGLGLGLYLSKQIIDQHQGQIAVESVSGAGTTLTIWLPQVDDHEDDRRDRAEGDRKV